MRIISLVLISLLVGGCASTVPYSKRVEEAERSGICYVHHQPMTKQRLPIAYGLIGFTQQFIDACDSQFPFAHRAILGGCVQIIVVDDPERSSPAYQDAYVCSRCTA